MKKIAIIFCLLVSTQAFAEGNANETVCNSSVRGRDEDACKLSGLHLSREKLTYYVCDESLLPKDVEKECMDSGNDYSFYDAKGNLIK